MTRITLENENGKYSAEIEDEEIGLPKLLSSLVIPTILAAGYDSDNVFKRVVV